MALVFASYLHERKGNLHTVVLKLYSSLKTLARVKSNGFSYLVQLTQEEKVCSQPPLDIALKNIKSGPALAKSENVIQDPSGDSNLLMV
jgi:hypothetical protein